MKHFFEGEQAWIIKHKTTLGTLPAIKEARHIFLTDAIQEAKTLEDLKPILLRLLNNN